MNGENGFLLDTNVLSEARTARPNPQVVARLRTLNSPRSFISVLTVGELRKGVELKRRNDPVAAMRISLWVDNLELVFVERVLPVDLPVARLWGVLSADRGRPIVDTMIAATALVHDLTLVTRNTAHVQGLGLSLINPWDESA